MAGGWHLVYETRSPLASTLSGSLVRKQRTNASVSPSLGIVESCPTCLGLIRIPLYTILVSDKEQEEATREILCRHEYLMQ